MASVRKGDVTWKSLVAEAIQEETKSNGPVFTKVSWVAVAGRGIFKKRRQGPAREHCCHTDDGTSLDQNSLTKKTHLNQRNKARKIGN